MFVRGRKRLSVFIITRDVEFAVFKGDDQIAAITRIASSLAMVMSTTSE